jgi:tRNA pseudouridine32 synthase/23S rRNA pseudouridine746 synthase
MPGAKFILENLVIWLDEAFLVVNKPAGLPTLPDGYDPDAPYLGGILRSVYDPLWIVHRLDRDTSGILILARTPESHRALNTQFSKRQVTKVYHALVGGNPVWDEKTVRLPLRPDGDRKHRTVIDLRQGKPSVTHFRVLERYGTYALIEATPKTGRPHQIRAHLAAQGCPIAADGLYGDGKGIFLSELKPGYRKGRQAEAPLLGRLGLHACSLLLAHPVSGEKLRFEAPYPKDFAATMKQLRKLR